MKTSVFQETPFRNERTRHMTGGTERVHGRDDKGLVRRMQRLFKNTTVRKQAPK